MVLNQSKSTKEEPESSAEEEEGPNYVWPLFFSTKVNICLGPCREMLLISVNPYVQKHEKFPIENFINSGFSSQEFSGKLALIFLVEFVDSRYDDDGSLEV